MDENGKKKDWADFVFSRCPISRLKIYKMKRMVYEMIQDIAPHKYDNAFSDRKPELDDYVLMIHNNSALLINRDAKAQDGSGNITLIRRSFLKYQCSANWPQPYPTHVNGRFIYFQSMKNHIFFWRKKRRKK